MQKFLTLLILLAAFCNASSLNAEEPAKTPTPQTTTAAPPPTPEPPPAVVPEEATHPSHGIILFGKLKYPADFKHFDYVNPDAPKGGELRQAALSTFDSLNSYILKGVKIAGMALTFDSLMVGSLDEPQSFYGLIAETVQMAPDRSWMEFKLRKEAKWHDGTPITPEDVIFTFFALRDKGDPSYKIIYAGVKDVTKTGPQLVRFIFDKAANRDLPLIIATMPVISKTYYATHDFEKTTLEPPLGNGPYKVKSVDQGHSLVLERVKDYWGKDLPVNVGQNNFDTIRFDVYTDETVALEALKAGAYDVREEYIARNWATAYNNVKPKNGIKFIKQMVPHTIPQGMQAFLFNTRKTKFQDRRVREAIDLAMDFEWINKALFYNAYLRNTSFFENTPFAATGLPSAEEMAILTPFKDKLPPELFTTEYHPPKTDGTSSGARDNLLRAQDLLNQAGWVLKDGKRVNDKTGEKLEIEFLLRQATFERVVAPIRKNLRKLGITASIRVVDDSQYQKLLDDGDFDIITIWYNKGLFFPGNEQMSYWHSSQADVKGSNNLAGLKNPVVDAILEKVLSATTLEELTPAARALDRVLLWEHLVISNWHVGGFRMIYWDKFGQPKIAPSYGQGLMTWWMKDKDSAATTTGPVSEKTTGGPATEQPTEQKTQ